MEEVSVQVGEDSQQQSAALAFKHMYIQKGLICVNLSF
jgi:hypothetical protein